MRLRVDGRLRVVCFAALTVVTLRTGLVLRVLRFFGAVAFGVAGALDLTGIRSIRVYPLIVPNKKPLTGFCNKLKQ